MKKLFNKILESTYGITEWNPGNLFVFEGKEVPKDMNGFETLSDQFQSDASLQQKCFTSNIEVSTAGKLFTVSTYVIQVKWYELMAGYAVYRPVRWFSINIVFDEETNIIPKSSTIKMYEDGKEVEDMKIPLPPLPGVLGNAIEIASWGAEFIEWIKEYLPDDWGALGLAVSEIAEIISMAISTADSILDGETNLELLIENSLLMSTTLSTTYNFEPDGAHGYCYIDKWNEKGEDARIYQPRIIAGAASWTMLLKTDRMRSWVYNDDHLILSITGDYKGNILGVMASWKFVDEDPEEGEFSKSTEEEGQNCLDVWQAEVRNYLGSPVPKEFTQWYVETVLRPWLDTIYSLGIKEPDNPK